MSEGQKACPQRYARTCGVLYAYIIAAGIFAEVFVRSRLVVSGDAAATAVGITNSELLFRIGAAGELLHLLFDVAVAVLLYALLRRVDRDIALLAALMRLASDVVLATASASHFAALRLLSGAAYLTTFQPRQLQSLASLALKLHGDAYAISLVFFGAACLALGTLLYRSKYFPAAFGVAFVLAGACYLVSSFAHFLSPRTAAALFPALIVPPFLAELSFAMWLIVKGVDLKKWDRGAIAPPSLETERVAESRSS
jgi:hypothetical protein